MCLMDKEYIDKLNPAIAHVYKFFAYEHLPEHLQKISKLFCFLANDLLTTVPHNQELTVALRKLLEAKDAAVRANIVVKD